MIKVSLFTLFTSLTIMMGALLADGVVIDHNLPATLQPGEKTIVSVNINKGEVTGFAKLQLEIPAGLTARAIKKSGASFTFSGQKAKFIWMTLPDKQEFQVEYELEAGSTVNGSKVIEGQFSYIKQNERVDYDIAPQIINVGDVVVENTEDTSNQESETVASSTTSSVTTSDARATRVFTPVGDGEYFVEVSAEDVVTDGFAKLVEEITPGYAIKEESAGESIVTVEDNSIKFVWFEIPSDPSYSVSYMLTRTTASSAPEIDGKFSFVQNNETAEVAVIHQEIVSARDFGGAEDLADETETEAVEQTQEIVENTTENTETESSVSDAQDNADNVTSTQTQEKNNVNTNTSSSEDEVIATTEETISNIPDPENGINYKVQLAATHKYIAANTFKKNNGISESIQTENHEGWTKFVTGSHAEYKQARDARNEITATYKKLRGPFVTAYNNGERITVQEALMISKQKWYQ